MAKITKILINQNANNTHRNEISVLTVIDFHDIDISLNMEYILHLFVYDVNGNKDIPVIISNWDDTKIIEVSKNNKKDDFLGKKHLLIKTENLEKKSLDIVTNVGLNIGAVTPQSPLSKRTLEVFATLIPAVDRVSKWSENFKINLMPQNSIL